MRDALKDTPVRDFKPPKEARFGYVNGVREAFRAGTEPRSVPLPADGPRSYNEAWGQGATAAPPGVATPPPPTQPKQPPADLNGLF
ncbi:MAG: hypothetical protein EON94_16525 [Caulobacteraceae bacterium]|nr:MAG: hypothetical protein EON94_16525 [Caulobacteraceae bacterium]